MVFLDTVEETSSFSFDSLSTALMILIIVVGAIIGILAVVAAVMSIVLAIKYLKFNRWHTEAGIAGKDVARQLLDKNGLDKIKVKRASIFATFTVGNSYSHYFKKIRLRGLIYNKDSVTSVGIAGQKVALALLDKEKDPDMVKRIKLTPIVYFGPFLFVPLVLIGIILDIIFFHANGIVSIIFTCLGFLFYLLAFYLSLKELKTEKKAQDRALEILCADHYLNYEEREACVELFHIYNINYVLSMIIALLEAIKQLLKILLQIAQHSNSSNS